MSETKRSDSLQVGTVKRASPTYEEEILPTVEKRIEYHTGHVREKEIGLFASRNGKTSISEILPTVEKRIEEGSDSLPMIGSLCFKLSDYYVQRRRTNPEASGSIEPSIVGTFQNLDEDVRDAFSQIERTNWQGEDLDGMARYIRNPTGHVREKEFGLLASSNGRTSISSLRGDTSAREEADRGRIGLPSYDWESLLQGERLVLSTSQNQPRSQRSIEPSIVGTFQNLVEDVRDAFSQISSDSLPAGTAERASPAYEEILLPVKKRIEEGSDSLATIGSLCYKVSGWYVQRRRINPEASGNIEPSIVGTFQNLDEDVRDAFSQIERTNWQGEDLGDLARHLRTLYYTALDKEVALETGSSKEEHH
ncbi:hypothetical protein MMC07_006700 [Pseudocyphellaria aurata]|nr:hypothetical protein [Pseudocyphellaria aurata]